MECLFIKQLQQTIKQLHRNFIYITLNAKEIKDLIYTQFQPNEFAVYVRVSKIENIFN